MRGDITPCLHAWCDVATPREAVDADRLQQQKRRCHRRQRGRHHGGGSLLPSGQGHGLQETSDPGRHRGIKRRPLTGDPRALRPERAIHLSPPWPAPAPAPPCRPGRPPPSRRVGRRRPRRGAPARRTGTRDAARRIGVRLRQGDPGPPGVRGGLRARLGGHTVLLRDGRRQPRHRRSLVEQDRRVHRAAHGCAVRLPRSGLPVMGRAPAGR